MTKGEVTGKNPFQNDTNDPTILGKYDRQIPVARKVDITDWLAL